MNLLEERVENFHEKVAIRLKDCRQSLIKC